MLWDEVVGHAAVTENLRKAVEQGRLNHAYLFTGPSAVGKFIVARVFAAAILCPDNGCGECDVCRRVVEEKHPDLVVIRPMGKNIPVDVIREIRLDTFKKPTESEHKIYIIKNAERMWDEGASTLLKVLEEPPGNVIFILVTASPGAVLPTIRSRCQQIEFSMAPYGELRDYIRDRKNISTEMAELAVRLTGGVLGRALDWCDESWRFARRDTVLRAARSLRRADLNQTLETAQELFRQVRAPVEELAACYQERKKELDNGSLDDDSVRRLSRTMDEELKREQVKEEIRGTKEVLTTLAWWYRDILVYKEGGDLGLLVNVDLEHEIASEAGAISSKKLVDCIDLLGESMRAAEQNVPLRLNLESALLGIQEALYG